MAEAQGFTCYGELRRRKIVEALREIGDGFNVCYICANSQVVRQAVFVAVSIAKPDVNGGDSSELLFSNRRMIFMSILSDPSRLYGFDGKVMFDPGPISRTASRTASNERAWRILADGCNARFPTTKDVTRIEAVRPEQD